MEGLPGAFIDGTECDSSVFIYAQHLGVPTLFYRVPREAVMWPDESDIAPVADAYGTKAAGAVAASAQVSLAGQEVEALIDAAVSDFAVDRVVSRRPSPDGRVGSAGTRTRNTARFRAPSKSRSEPR